MRASLRSWTRILLLGVSSVAAGACATPPSPPQQTQLAQALSPPERDAPPAELPGPARALLRSRMANHVRDMGDLVSAIMLLDYPRIEEQARRIVGDISLSRPLTDDATELNSALPAAFYDRQDALRAEARKLAEDAQARDARRVAADYGHLSEACVRCHADYRPAR